MPDQPPNPRIRHRLVMSLDGTWNQEDSGTNILHHHTLAREGAQSGEGDEIWQTRYYHPGVGTSALDGISGGGFGFGLEKNVREAYNWLVAHYHDDDEIFLFGFSRGAYTARSLVGFIATVGLLKRGAPLTVDQLWTNYCLIGRQREHRSSVWDRCFGEPPISTRRITDLVDDPWGHQPREPQTLSKTERRLIKWSRRIRITYLGVYDTVGAIGIDALAIPGVRSQLAMHHNLRATTIVSHCRHALAVDEHRSSFNHTPLSKYIGHGFPAPGDVDAALVLPARPADPAAAVLAAGPVWREQDQRWDQSTVQRWFVGAHSNVGGGYPDNELAQGPLDWLLQEAKEIGLALEDFQYTAPDPTPPPNDSYTEFAKPFWTHVIRGKRFYRRIAPLPEPSAAPTGSGGEEQALPGYSLVSIHEEVDDSVLGYAARQARTEEGAPYQPPNLVEYAARVWEGLPDGSPQKVQLQAIAKLRPLHVWLPTRGASAILVLWASTASYGVEAVRRFFDADIYPPLTPWTMGLIAAFFAAIDWQESQTNHQLALKPDAPRLRAWSDALYWLRTCGFLLFVFGFFAVIIRLWTKGWHAGTLWAAAGEASTTVSHWWPVPIAAGAALWTASLLDRAFGKNWWQRWLLGGAGGIALAPILAFAMVLAGWLASVVLAPVRSGGTPAADLTLPGGAAHLAGRLLLMAIGGLCLWQTFLWVDEPTERLHLDSIRRLQSCFSAQGVTEQLSRWRDRLTCRWDKPGGNQLTGLPLPTLMRALREAMWRDAFGFIPLYALVLGCGVRLAQTQFVGLWPKIASVGLPAWSWLLLVTVLADYGEDACQLRLIEEFAEGRQLPAILPRVSYALSWLKFLTMTLAFFLSAAGFALGFLELAADSQGAGWRGAAALLVVVLAGLGLMAIIFLAIWYRLWKRTNQPG